MAQASSGEFLSPEAVLAFSDGLFEARSQDGIKFNFSATLIFDDKHRPFMTEKIRDVVGRKWGDKGQRDLDAGRIKNPLLEGDGPQAYSKASGELWGGFGPGKFFIRANANKDAQPSVYWKSRHVQANKEDVYSGCIGKAVLNAYTWENPSGGRGVSFGIRAFQKLKEGEPLGGRAPFNPEKWIVDLEDDVVDVFK